MTSGAALSEEFLRDFGTRWLDAWNSHDTDHFLSLVHPSIEWEDTVFWPDVIRGVDDLRAYVDAIWEVMPGVEFREVQLFTAPADGRALCLFEQSGRAPDRFGGEQKSFRTYGCDIFLEFTDGKLSHYLAQYEITDMMRQFDALPPRGDRVGGAYLLSLLGSAYDGSVK